MRMAKKHKKPVVVDKQRGLSVAAAAKSAGYHPCKVYEWVAKRKIDYYKDGRGIRISPEALDRFLKTLTVPAK